MNKLLCLLLILFVHGLFPNAASAQGGKAALVPLPSVEDFTRGKDGWGFGIGAGVEYESAYEGSDEFGFALEPAGGVQWRRGDDVFYWVGEALGWRGLRARTWLLEAAVGFDEGRKESDSKAGRLRGLGNAKESVELVLQARFAFDPEWRYWAVGRVVTGSNGSLALLGLGRRFGDRLDGSGSEVNLVAVFHNSKFANRGFGISERQSAASGLNQTTLNGGLRSFALSYVFRHNLNKDWQLFGEALYERFGSDIRASPIARSSYEAEVGVGFVYRF